MHIFIQVFLQADWLNLINFWQCGSSFKEIWTTLGLVWLLSTESKTTTHWPGNNNPTQQATVCLWHCCDCCVCVFSFHIKLWVILPKWSYLTQQGTWWGFDTFGLCIREIFHIKGWRFSWRAESEQESMKVIELPHLPNLPCISFAISLWKIHNEFKI